MKKILIIFIIVLCWTLNSSLVFAYSRVETRATRYHGETLYFVKTFYDTNLYDRNFQHKQGGIAINIDVVNNSDFTEWYNQATRVMVNEGVSAGWRRADYIYFLEEKLLQAAQENDEQKRQILNALIVGLEEVKERKRLIILSDVFISLYIQKRLVQPSLLSSVLSGTNNLESDYTNRIIVVLKSCLPINNYFEPDAVVQIFNDGYLETKYSVGGRKKKLYFKRGELSKHFFELFKKISRRLGNDNLRPLQTQERR